jgi:hypothetical protein
MADDVKVKFGGDFSEIDKDAKSASKRIGSALGGWIGEYATDIKEKLKDAFSLEKIFSKYIDGVKEYFQKFEDLDNLSKKLGVTAVELQQFGQLGKEAGVEMETMGQSIAYANRMIGSMKDNERIKKLMLDLGFSTKEVTNANIKSLEILYKLADAYEKNKKEFGDTIANNMLAKDSSEVFGRSAYNLNGIIKEGTTALKERIETMKVFSDAEVKAGARASKMSKRGAETFEKYTYGSVASFIGTQGAKFEIFDKLKEIMAKEGVDYSGALNKRGSQIKIAETLAQEGKRMGLDASDLSELISNRYNKPGRRLFAGSDEKAFIGFLVNNLNEIQKEFDSKKNVAPSGILSTSGQTVLSASSLQQIGGGDVSSVLAGSTTQNIESNTLRTANAVEKIANEGTQPQPPASVAK